MVHALTLGWFSWISKTLASSHAGSRKLKCEEQQQQVFCRRSHIICSSNTFGRLPRREIILQIVANEVESIKIDEMCVAIFVLFASNISLARAPCLPLRSILIELAKDVQMTLQ
jgi:hypothetical protein